MLQAVMSSKINLKGKKVTVLGAARSGVAAANMVIRLGGTAKLSEFKSESATGEEIQGLNSKVLKEFGGHTRDFIEDSDYIVLSPGVRKDIAPVGWATAQLSAAAAAN